MKTGVSVRETIDLILVPLSLLSGVLTISFAPVPDFVKWLVGGMLVAFAPMAIIVVHLIRRKTKARKRKSKKEHGIAVVIW